MLSNIHILRTLFRNARRVKEEYYAARNEVARLETRREELRQKVASLAQNDLLLGGDDTIDKWDKSVRQHVEISALYEEAVLQREKWWMIYKEMFSDAE